MLSAATRALSPVLVLHQEGVVGLLAVAGLAFREDGPLAALLPYHSLPVSLAWGVLVGAGSAGLLWLLRFAPGLRQLEQWQRDVVGSWSALEALAVAFLSGVAEEALLRAFLQPLAGIWMTSLAFAVLHLAPDRRLWIWPFVAVAIGLAFGVLFEFSGYPACAAAHATVNFVALLRLRQGPTEGGTGDP